MFTLKTDKKFTVMLSAYQATNTDLQNLIASALMKDIITNSMHCHAITAIGVYNGRAEVSYVVHTNSSQIMTRLKRYALDECEQECVLVSNNRKHDIQLHNSDATTAHIGNKFRRQDKVDKHATSYTVLNGTDYWSVI